MDSTNQPAWNSAINIVWDARNPAMERTAAYCRTDYEVHYQISYDVKYGAGRPNPQHEFADGRSIPFPRFFQKFCVYIVPRNCSAGDVIDQVQQNQVDGSHRQERQECRCCQYGEHIPEVGGSCHFEMYLIMLA